MSSSQLEIISRGSVDILVPESDQTPELISQTSGEKGDQHTALEPLPPERPRCPDHHQTPPENDVTIPLCLEEATQELADSQRQTENLLQRIEQLSGRIKSGLCLVENTSTTLPTLPLANDIIAGSDSNYDVMMTSLDNGESGAETEQEVKSGEDEGEEKRGVVSPDVDPKLLRALEKMRRLDKKLADIVMREREVKEQRRELEQQMTGVDCYAPYSTTEYGVSPVFPTQVPDDPKQDSTGEDSIGQSPANGTDLVKRNIEEAGGLALTEAERVRLEQLLAQDEDHSETEESSTVSVQSNGFSLSIAAQTALRHIDMQLQALNHQAPVSASSCELIHTPRELERQRLTEIDEKLAMLQNPSTPPPSSSPSESHVLSPTALHHLLEQCTKEHLS